MPPNYYNYTANVEKMKNVDPDFRFMGLTDLTSDMRAGIFILDVNQEGPVVDEVLKHMDDPNSEVKNVTVGCVSQMIRLVSDMQKERIMTTLIGFLAGNKADVRDVTSLALKTITMEISTTGSLANLVSNNLVLQLLWILQNAEATDQLKLEALTVLTTIFSRLTSSLAKLPVVLQQSFDVLSLLLKSSHSVIRKRAIVALATLLPLIPPEAFAPVLYERVYILSSSSNGAELLTSVQFLTAVGRHAPERLAADASQIVESLIMVTGQSDEEIKEGALQALEQLVLRCPTEVTPNVPSICNVAVQYIKYDPNYVDDDDEMEDDDEEEDDDELGDEYDDGEDTSYKVRRSALKVLLAVVTTHPEYLLTLYKTVGSPLLSRFGDREESVRVEVWGVLTALVKQTEVYGVETAKVSMKRKRGQEEILDTIDEESSVGQLRLLVPGVAKALVKQVTPKSATATIVSAFTLLQAIQITVPGALAPHAQPLLTLVTKLLSLHSSELNAHLLSFLAMFFARQPARSFVDSLSRIGPPMLDLLSDRFPRVASEAFRASSELVKALKPASASPSTKKYAEKIYTEAIRRVTVADTDAAVKEKALECLGDVVCCAGEVAKDGKWMTELRGRGEMLGPAMRIVERVARDGADAIDKRKWEAWLDETLDWCLGIVKRGPRPLRVGAFGCLQVLVRRKTNMADATVIKIIGEMTAYLNDEDLLILTLAMSTLTTILQVMPASWRAVEKASLPHAYKLCLSPNVQGASLDALLAFFAALVSADQEIATHVVQNLIVSTSNVSIAGASGTGGLTALTTVSKCIATAVQVSPRNGAGVIAQFTRVIKSGKETESRVVLSLLALGEIGRFIDMSDQPEVFNYSLGFFTSGSEQVRSAAAFAVGNIALGNSALFLPVIIQNLQGTEQHRLSALHALREVVTNGTRHQLESVSDSLWFPLFENTRSGDESTKNVAAACLGKLTTTNPARFLPQLQIYIRDPAPEVRVAVATAIRYTFLDSAGTSDEFLAPVIIDFLSLMNDTDIHVQRAAIVSLNSAARNKPHLIRDHLPTILPVLYRETQVKPELIHFIVMGPWKHEVDDGLEARKAAFETMYTLLDTCITRLELHAFISRVIEGLSDKDEIKALCHMMIYRLAQIAPAPLIQRIDQIAAPLETTMAPQTMTKDTVKQDMERYAEMQQSAVRAIAALVKQGALGHSTKFDSIVEATKKGPLSQAYTDMLS